MHGEMSAQQELSAFRHLDGQELAGPRPLGDLRRDERDGVVRAEASRGQDLGPDAFHPASPATAAASANESRTCDAPPLTAS